MIHQDQLTRNERIRLEALSQANAFGTMKHLAPNEVVDIAILFEKFLHEADLDYPQHS